jgi:hypothetical protein
MIEAGVGLSSASSTVVAASEAAALSASELSGGRADLAIVFATGEHADEIPSLLASVERSAGTPYVVGCSASGVIAGGRELEDGPAIGVLSIRSDAIRATPFLFRDSGDQGLTAGIHVGQRLAGSRATEDVVLVWPDPTTGWRATLRDALGYSHDLAYDNFLPAAQPGHEPPQLTSDSVPFLIWSAQEGVAQVPFGQLLLRHWTLSVHAAPTSSCAAHVMPDAWQ